MSRTAMGRPIKLLLSSGRVRKTGAKRSTVYALGSERKAKGKAAT
jgi:hypothetical protein